MLAARQHRARTEYPAVIDMLERAFVWSAARGGSVRCGCRCGWHEQRGCDLIIVGVVVAFQVVVGTGDCCPGLGAVQGMHSIVPGLPRTNRREGVVVVERFDRSVDAPILNRMEGCVDDYYLFVDGHIAIVSLRLGLKVRYPCRAALR